MKYTLRVRYAHNARMGLISFTHPSHTDLKGPVLHTREEHAIARLGHAKHTTGVRKCGENAALSGCEMYCDLL